MSETVQIKDSAGTWLKLEISTPPAVNLSINLALMGNYKMWRPNLWGGSWSASDKGLISCTGGEIWYRRTSLDVIGSVPADRQHLDIFLFKEGEPSRDNWVIKLESFLSLNGMNSSGGGGFINQSWALQIKPGEIGWDIRERMQNRAIFSTLADD